LQFSQTVYVKVKPDIGTHNLYKHMTLMLV